VDTHRIPGNPCRSRVLRLPVTRRDWVILDRTDTRRLLAAATIQPHLEALYVLAVTTGMRVGEICAVRWQDIDLDKGTLKVNATINRDENNRLARLATKTDRARRTIRLPDIAVEACVGHPVMRARRSWATGISCSRVTASTSTRAP
jgi:integrase